MGEGAIPPSRPSTMDRGDGWTLDPEAVYPPPTRGDRPMSEMAIGMVGRGVMGRNLALNIEEKGFSVAAWDAWPEPVDAFVAASQGKQIAGFKELEAFVK